MQNAMIDETESSAPYIFTHAPIQISTVYYFTWKYDAVLEVHPFKMPGG